MVIEREAGNADIICHDTPGDVARAVSDAEGDIFISEGTAGLGTEEFMVALERFVNFKKRTIDKSEPRTQPPPSVDVQFSEPTQKSADPESIKMRKSRGGLPI